MIKIDASCYQKNFYLEWKLDPDSIKYNLFLLFDIKGSLNLQALENSLVQFIHYGQNQRTFFGEEKNALKQCIVETVKKDVLEVYDLSLLKKPAQKKEIHQLLTSIHQHKFNLHALPLYRYALIKRAHNDYLFTGVWHHIIADGAFLDHFVAFISQAYNALMDNKVFEAPKLAEMRDYIDDEKKSYSDREQQRDLAFWEEELAGSMLHTPLPTISFSKRADHPLFSLDKALSQKVMAFLKQNNTSLFVFLMSVFALLIKKYTSQKELVLSYPVNLKPKRFPYLLGCFVNTAVIKLFVDSKHTVNEWIEHVKQQRAIVKRHQKIPLLAIVSCLRKHNNYKENAFNVTLAETSLGLQPLTLLQCECHAYSRELQHMDDLGCHFQYYLEKIYLKFDHNGKYFDDDSIHALFTHFKCILEQFIAFPKRPIVQINSLSKQELQRLKHWSGRTKVYQKHQTICQLFEEQVVKNPQGIAVQIGEEVYTYEDINKRANQLAHLIGKRAKQQQITLAADSLIGLSVQRSSAMIVGILAILKAGAAYVPLDPDYPEERLKYILDDCQPSLIITEEKLVLNYSFIAKSYSDRLLIIDDLKIKKELLNGDTTNVEKISAPHDLVYVIYTSGSTGKPKGVLVEQRAVLNYFYNQVDYLNLTQPKSFYFIHSYAFDTSISSIFGALLSGGKLILVKENQRLNELNFLKYDIDIAYLPPAFLAAIDPENIAHIGTIIVSGESANSHVLAKLKAAIINEYGPTECTVCTTYTRINKQDKPINVNILGKSLFNTTLTILDPEGNPCPVGVPGELYIGGMGVARGYLNQKALSDERFIPNPCPGFIKSTPSGRFYKTGDMMRWLPDGSIEYIGRMDFQVKIRGYRVELGEIENTLMQLEGIQQTTVIVCDEEGQKYLALYYVPLHRHSPLQAEALRAYLSHHLPDYMLPSVFIKMDVLPLTVNGKVDRKALPKPERGMVSSASAIVPPRNELETQLAAIWCHILRIPQLSIHDNFFSLGGDSILSIQVASLAREHQLYFTPKDLFQNPTIAELSSLHLKQANVEAEQGRLSGKVPLTPIQQWFFSQKFAKPQHWNQAQLLIVDEPIDPALLQKAFALIIEHHDALRLRYTLNEKAKKYQQAYDNTLSAEHIVLKPIDLSMIASRNKAISFQKYANQLQEPLDISRGPLISVGIFTGFDDKKERVLIVIHHLVVDSVSWRLLISDLESCYQQLKRYKTAKLSAKTSSYKAWAQALIHYAQTTAIHDLAYWKKVQEAIIPLKTDIACERKEASSLEHLSCSFDTLATSDLISRSHHAYHTKMNDLLLAALALSLRALQKQESVSFNLEGHGREALVSKLDITRTMGWFTSLFPVVLSLPLIKNSKHLDDKQSSLNIYNKLA